MRFASSLSALPSRVQPLARCLTCGGVLALALTGTAFAATYLVLPDGSGDFPTIQAAIDGANDGDTILLGNGLFTGAGNRDLTFAGKAITLRSQGGTAEACVIDCEGSSTAPHRGISATLGEGNDTVLSGVTIRNGYDATAGGGMLITGSSPTITDCIFRNCFGDLGGAVACQTTAAPHFARCLFEADSAAIGGAVNAGENAAPSFSSCTFSQNGVSIEAGAISLQYQASTVLRDCLFADNRGGFRGGGLLADDYAQVDAAYCTFVGNSAEGGGGAYCCALSLGHFAFCTFYANAAPQGAQLCCGCHGIATLENCILVFGIHGPGVYCWSTGEAHLTCSDVYGNAAGDWFGYIAPQYGVDGNICEDPVFCDPGARDLTLHAGSPCLEGHHPLGDPCGLMGAWGLGCPIEAAPDGDLPPAGWRLAIAGGNPFAGSTWIACQVPTEAQGTTLAVYDFAGRRVRALAPAGLSGGTHRIAWDGADDLGRPVATGVYFVRLGGKGLGLEQRVCRVR